MQGRWLKWKIDRGLTYRGRPTENLSPKGVFAKILHFLYFKRANEKVFNQYVVDSNQRRPVQFHQHVGGSIGPAGKTNGE